MLNCRGGSRIFFRRGCTRLLLYFNTNKPHSFFLWQNTSCIRKPQVISGWGGGAHPLHPPPRSAPELKENVMCNEPRLRFFGKNPNPDFRLIKDGTTSTEETMNPKTNFYHGNHTKPFLRSTLIRKIV